MNVYCELTPWAWALGVWCSRCPDFPGATVAVAFGPLTLWLDIGRGRRTRLE